MTEVSSPRDGIAAGPYPGNGGIRTRGRFAVLRSMTISTRLLLLTFLAVLTSMAVCLIAIWGINGLDRLGSEQVDVGDAIRLNGEAIAHTRSLGSGVPPSAAELQSLAETIRRTSVLAADHVDPQVLTNADDASVALNENLNDETMRDAFVDEAVRARLKVSEALSRRRSTLAVDIASMRRTALLGVLGSILLGAAFTFLAGRRVAQSIVDPALAVGRTVRRFGDGDVSVRAEVEPDEIGLVARSFNVMADGVGHRVTALSADAERGAHRRSVADALDVAVTEREVQGVVGRALGLLVPGVPSELMLTEATTSRLTTVAANPTVDAPCCPVESASDCVAMRRAQPVVFDGPEAINTCPYLVGRPRDVSAACVPVSVNGHLLGVIHSTGPLHAPPDEGTVEKLTELAGQAGTHIGSMRTLEATRVQASTDGLTGLPNRRMLEARLSELMLSGTAFVLAVADIDNFKNLNDTYGHEIGDRALQVFARVLERNVRGHDLVARYGGEEFVLVYPEMTVKPSMEVIERIRDAVRRELLEAGLPSFTVSFGVTHSGVGDSVDEIVRIADAGLLMAKQLGRNRVVYSDAELAAEIFAGTIDEKIANGEIDGNGERVSPVRP